MAFSYGFFDSKNLDRTYTAENFCDYLGSLICNGIQDNYGGCFKLNASKLKLTIASGKAWIDGHYFISDTAYTYDLSKYVDESLPRYVSIGICCNTGESYRKIEFELSVGTPATSPAIPRFSDTDTRTYLTLCAVRIEAGATSLLVNDYRENSVYCGYVRCILGKCKVTEMLVLMGDMTATAEKMKTEIEMLQNTVDTLQTKVDDLTGDVVKAGSLGVDVYYVLYANGTVLVRGSGAMYDYDLNSNSSPLRENNDVKSVVISEGVTTIGAYVFESCQNLKTVSMPQSIQTIGNGCFMQNDNIMGRVYGLEDVVIPARITAIKGSAFWGSAIKSINIPATVTTIEKYVCRDCLNLESVKVDGQVIGPYMFTGCSKLKNMVISANLKRFGEHALNYCSALQTITFKGTLAQWEMVEKGFSWDGHGGMEQAQSGLTKIQCTDGFMEYDAENKEWKEVRA